MSPLTPLHYLLIGAFLFMFLVGVILSFRTKSPYSLIVTIGSILALIGVFSWMEVNKIAYQVEITNVSQERYYQSEQVLVKGVVRNIGDYPVKNVVAVVKMTNKEGPNSEKASQFSQPTVFAELFEGDDPEFKRQNVIERHVIADSLQAGKSKTFHIMIDYPPHFNKASYQIVGEVD